MSERKGIREHGLSLRLFIIIMFLAGIVVSGLVLLTAYRASELYGETETTTQDYIACQEDIYVITDAINELNERARNFAVTGNLEEAIRYYNEVQVQRSLEGALEDLKRYLADDPTLKHMDAAIELSGQMADIQYYAMRLTVEAYGYNVEKCPVPLRSVALSEEDLALSAPDQRARALDMLFAKDYTLLKAQVDNRINLCKDTLIKAMMARHNERANELFRFFREQRALVVSLVITLLLVLVFVLAMVVSPLYRLVRGILDAQTIEANGASEIRFLTRTYNQMHRQMEAANSRLSYEAAHDALTGLYNRSAYEALREQARTESIALLIVDVDYFKEVNDSYGHDIGDRVLIRVARVLQDSFRDADKVCRIGGDEFSVIMMGVNDSIAHIIRRKIAAASQILNTPDGSIPAVTISVGCAFSDQLRAGEDLFKNADRALYRVKESGRNSCGFYTSSSDCPTPGQDTENGKESEAT